MYFIHIFSMKVILDYREKDLIDLCNSKLNEEFKNINLSNENLPIGDVIIKDDNDNELIIIALITFYYFILLLLFWTKIIFSKTKT